MAEKRARTPKKLNNTRKVIKPVTKPIVIDLVENEEVVQPRTFNAAEIEFIKTNHGKLPLKNIAKSLECSESELAQFIELMNAPNPQRTEAVKNSFAKRGGATVATQASSSMGDESRHSALKKNPNFIYQINKDA